MIGRLSALLFCGIVLVANTAAAQQPARPTGTFTPGHAFRSNTPSGSPYSDAGGSAGSAIFGSGYLTELGITNTGLPLCINDALTSSPSGYHRLCLGTDASGNGLMSFDNVGGATLTQMYFSLNGTRYLFPFTSGAGVLGPTPTVISYLTTWNNTAGTLLGNPSTAALDAQGLNVAKGRAPVQNGIGSAMQVVYLGTVDNAGHQSSPIYTRNEYNGSDPLANPNGIYGTLWYYGTNGSDASAIKGNFYTYDSSRTLTGVEPNAYLSGPSIGTLPIASGLYGRVAHYIPGTLHEAASVFADGIYNVGTAGGSVVDNWQNFLAGAPYTTAPTNKYVLRATGGACSPNCWDATIMTTADPLILKTAGTEDIRLQPASRVFTKPSSVSALTGSSNTPGLYDYMTAGAVAYHDAVASDASTTNQHWRTYAGAGVYNDMILDGTGALYLGKSTRASPMVGSSSVSGLNAYMTSSADFYLDAVASGANTATINLRTYNNAVYSTTRLDQIGRMFMGGYFFPQYQTWAQITGNCTADNKGGLINVSDSNVGTAGSTITGSGVNDVLSRCDGLGHWIVVI